jgi:Zn-dependent M28 family amino/carboxypeptidase
MKKIFLTLSFSIALNGLFAQLSFDSTILIQNLKDLSSDAMQGRKTGTEGSKKAQAYIIDQLKKIGVAPLMPDYLQSFTVTAGDAANIVAVIPGKKKETIVLSAHYDHLGIRNEVIFNGADDNASGVATLLAMAQYFIKNKPEHRLIFAFFDAEEMGLRGSAHFVKALDLKKENVVLNVNLDMVSRGDKNELYACGGFHHPDVKKKLEKVVTPAGFKLSFGHDDPAMKSDDWTKQSDQYNFYQQNIPFVYFGVEDHPDYHRATDDFEKVNKVLFSKSAETILRSVKVLDK